MRATTKISRCWLAAPVLLSIAITACGGSVSQKGSASATKTQSRKAHTEGAAIVSPKEAKRAAPKPHLPPIDVDGDREGPGALKLLPGGRYDTDDTPLLHFGMPASTADRRAITTLVNRYHAFVEANDGRKGCALLHPLLIEGVIEDNPLPPGARQKTCGGILTVLFRQTARRKTLDLKRLHVIQVQTRRGEGIALLGRSHHRVEDSIGLRRLRHTWKIAEINDTGMP
jgi:hypothetical protein